VFTAGIGEHDADLRREVCEPLSHLGVEIDDELNRAPGGAIRAIDLGESGMRVLIIPTNEEAEIARQSAIAAAAS
jgi:acetate kinase